MSKFYVIAHATNNDNFIPINYKKYTEDWVDAIETAREYQTKYPDGIVEVVEEDGTGFRMIVTSSEITVINSFPFYWAKYPADTPTQSILEDVHPD